MNYSFKRPKTAIDVMKSLHNLSRLNFSKLIYIALTVLFLSFNADAQVSYENDVDIWHVYSQPNADITIEYSYQISSPTNQFSSKYLILKITNNSSSNSYVSWDFAKTDYKGNCKNCDGNMSEWKINKKLGAGEMLTIDVNEMNKNGLKWFVCFEDERYEGSSNQPWQSFELKNLTITTID